MNLGDKVLVYEMNRYCPMRVGVITEPAQGRYSSIRVNVSGGTKDGEHFCPHKVYPYTVEGMHQASAQAENDGEMLLKVARHWDHQADLLEARERKTNDRT